MTEQPVSERIKILLMEYEYGNKAQMGRSLGISGQAIADLIEGKKGGPSFSVLQKMLIVYSEVRAEWLIFGEEPMLKAKVEVSRTNKFLVSNPHLLTPDKITKGNKIDKVLDEEELTRVFQAAYLSFATNEKVKQEVASIKAQVEVDRDRLTQIYWIGKPDPSRPYNGLLTERLGISEEEAKKLVLSGELPAGIIGKSNRITNYRIGESAIQKFLEGMSGEKQRQLHK